MVKRRQLLRLLRPLHPNLKTSICALLLASLPVFADEVAQLKPPQHVRNFGEVNQNLLRGGMPTDEALHELKAFGVSVILDLREDGPSGLHEKQLAEELGIRYEHIPLSNFAAPSAADIARALQLLVHESSTKIYVHCLRGKDRTGTVIACYRIQHDGWDNQKALAEAKSYGMSSLEVAMQSFIRHFTPVKLP